MKAIILYKSKYGACREIGNIIAGELAVPCISLSDFKADIIRYDAIILGSSVYAGMVDKDIKAFCAEHQTILLTKKIFYYLAGLVKEGEALEKEWKENISAPLLQHITYKDVLGARLNFSEMNFFEKAIIKALNKQGQWVEKEHMKENIDLLDYDKIQRFITVLKRDLGND